MVKLLFFLRRAGVAQSVEQWIRNPQVEGSSPSAGSKLFVIFWLLIFFSFPSLAYPQALSWKIGPQAFYFYNKENSFDIKKTGILYGVNTNVTWGLSPRFSLNLDLDIAHNYLNYNGHTWQNSDLEAQSKDWLLKGVVYLYKDIGVFYNLNFSMFLGLGWQYWYNRLINDAGYLLETESWFFPIGFRLSKQIDKNIFWYLKMEADVLLLGQIKSYLSDVDNNLNDPSFHLGLGEGYGFFLESTLEKKDFSKILPRGITIFLRYWKMQDSETQILTYNGQYYTKVYEPQTYTISLGLRFLWSF